MQDHSRASSRVGTAGAAGYRPDRSRREKVSGRVNCTVHARESMPRFKPADTPQRNFPCALCRHRERPRRAWNVFLLDISKQGVSSGAGHLCGMAIALFAHRAPAAQGASECSLYFVVYFMDATLGITLAILFHKAMAAAAHLWHFRKQSLKDDDDAAGGLHWTESLLESGNYGDPPNYRKWAIQVAGWATCVVSARLSVGLTLMLTLVYMSRISRALDSAFKHHVNLELFVVMVGIPMLLNVGQAWIQVRCGGGA